MAPTPSGEITCLLKAWAAGDRVALDHLAPLVYTELRRMARRYMAKERLGHSLQATALVNEAFLRLVEVDKLGWQDRAHFFAVSAQMMRRILVDAARTRDSEKRGGGVVKVDLNESIDAMPQRGRELIALDETLDELSQFDQRLAKVVELRFFGGLSVEETAEVLKISAQSVMRDWKLAKAWLLRRISKRGQ